MRLLAVFLACGAAALAGWGDIATQLSDGAEDKAGEQNDYLEGELFRELDSAAFAASESEDPRDATLPEFDGPEAIDCRRPKPGRFRCVAFFQVADDVALTAEYRVRPCVDIGWRAAATDAHDRLTVPARLESFDCP